MFINGIKYVAIDQKVQAFKFGLSTGRFRNLISFHGKPEDIHRFKAAVIYALAGLEDESIVQAILYLSDDNGDHWIIDRSRSRSKFFKNKKEILAGGEQALKRSLLEWNSGERSVDDAAMVEMVDLQFLQSEWIGQKTIVGQELERDELYVRVQQRLRQEIDYLRRFLQVESDTDLVTLKLFLDNAWPAFQDLQNHEEQLKTLAKDFSLDSMVDATDIVRLEEEVQVIRKLASVAAPLLDPGKSPLVMKERYQKVEQDIEALSAKLGFKDIPKFHEDVDWARLIGLLARYQAFERLEQAYRKMVTRAENSLKPVLGHYIDAMRGFLRQDRRILTELEKSLDLVTQCVVQADQPQELPKKGIRSLLDRFSEVREPNPVMSDEQREEILGTSRESVNAILRILGEMHSNYEIASQRYEEGFDEIFHRHEKIIKELAVTKDMWLKSAKSLNIDPNSSIRNLLSMISELSQLINLDQERQNLRRMIADYRGSLRQVEDQLQIWYRLTGSQKTLDLSQPSILLREAKIILSYREQKEKLLEKNLKHKLRLEAFQAVEQRQRSQLLEAERRWKEAFSYLGKSEAFSHKQDWSQFFIVGLQVRALSDLIDRFQSGSKAKELLKNLSLDVPLTIFNIPRHAQGEKRRNLLLNCLESASPHGHAIILNPEPQLAENLQSLGIISAQEVDLTKKKVEAPKPAHESEALVLSERARAALELFKGKNQRSF
ncbi:MAG: hypothetical protein ACOH5I_19595 [Oligoflexus sp.]